LDLSRSECGSRPQLTHTRRKSLNGNFGRHRRYSIGQVAAATIGLIERIGCVEPRSACRAPASKGSFIQAPEVLSNRARRC
jgi:hypothetical protein